MINTTQFNFKFKKLYLGNKDIGFSVVPSETKGMWKIRWPDGELSKDHYNISWAKHHCVSEASKSLNIQLEGTEKAP